MFWQSQKSCKNSLVLENNRKKEVAHEKLRKEFDEFKNGKRSNLPIGPSGKAVTTRLPALKKEHLILQCHCYQMRCAREGTDCGSNCEMKCTDPLTGKRYKWVHEEGLKKCSCPVCRCNCRKAYKLDNIEEILADLALAEAESNSVGTTNKKEAEMKRLIEAQQFISDSISLGYKSLDLYKSAMEKMKAKGKFI